MRLAHFDDFDHEILHICRRICPVGPTFLAHNSVQNNNAEGLREKILRPNRLCMSNPITETKAQVRAAIASGQTAGALARQAGLHRNALYGSDSPEWDPKSSTLEKIWPHLQPDS